LFPGSSQLFVAYCTKLGRSQGTKVRIYINAKNEQGLQIKDLGTM